MSRKRKFHPQRIVETWIDPTFIRAAEPPDNFRICGEGAPLELQADAPAADGKPALKRFSINAYTGGPMKLEGFAYLVVADLAGMSVPRQNFPILKDHDRNQVVGHTNKADISASGVNLSGVISGVGSAAKEVLDLAANGFPWQASIGARVHKLEFVERGQTAQANGRTFTGPVYIARQTTLYETSFVSIGADASSSATVAATASTEKTMYEQWLKARNFDPAKLTEPELKLLRAAFDAEQKTPPAPPPSNGQTPAEIAAKFTADLEKELKAAREKVLATEAVETKRCADIRARVAKHDITAVEIEIDGKKTKVDLVAHAIEKNWTPAEAELLALQQARPKTGPHIHSASAPDLNNAVLEAAALQAGRCRLFDEDFYDKKTSDRDNVPAFIKNRTQRELKARYTDQVQQAAHDHFRGRIGLQELLIAGARTHGYRGPDTIRDDGTLLDVLRAAFAPDIRADSSTISISNVLANVQNKFMLQGFLFTEMAWRQICGVRSVKDFKATKAINLLSDATFQKLGPDGELKHAALNDQAFANQAYTYGRMLAIPRQLIINDDPGGLTQAPMLLGRGAGLAINNLFWPTFMSPGFDDGGTTNFFATTHTLTGGQVGNANSMSGGSSALSGTALTAAVLLIDNQVDPLNLPLGIDAQILLYPPDLDTTARELMQSERVVSGNTTKGPDKNVWQNRFTPIKSRYLNKSTITGYSTTAWYLLVDPNILPTIEMVFLNGQETPTVQTAEADFNTLGIQMRAFFDAGCAMQNFRGAVKSAGA